MKLRFLVFLSLFGLMGSTVSFAQNGTGKKGGDAGSGKATPPQSRGGGSGNSGGSGSSTPPARCGSSSTGGGGSMPPVRGGNSGGSGSSTPPVRGGGSSTGGGGSMPPVRGGGSSSGGGGSMPPVRGNGSSTGGGGSMPPARGGGNSGGSGSSTPPVRGGGSMPPVRGGNSGGSGSSTPPVRGGGSMPPVRGGGSSSNGNGSVPPVRGGGSSSGGGSMPPVRGGSGDLGKGTTIPLGRPDRAGTGSGNNHNLGKSDHHGSISIGDIPRVGGSKIEREVLRESRVRPGDNRYRNGYWFYNNNWCDDNFYYPYYGYNYYDGCGFMPSPFYYYYHLPAYVSCVHVNIGFLSWTTCTTNYVWNPPTYWVNGYDRYDAGDLDYAVDGIRRSFERNSMRGLSQLIPSRGQVEIDVDGYNQYSMSSDDFYNMLRDLVENTRTESYRVTDVYRDGDRASVEAVHEYTDTWGREQRVRHSFGLRMGRHGYEIVYFRTSGR